MRYTHSLFLFCLALLTPILIHAQPASMPPKYEVRAVWLTTLGGSDWPRSHDMQEQQQSLRRIVQDLKEKNFNTIFFQVRPRGNAFYHSRYEPWAEELTGTAGKNPGWDPLAFLLAEAHAAGMEVHAWLNVAKVYGEGRPHHSNPAHVVDAHPSWVKKSGHEWWIDMGIPAAREYLKNIVNDVALSYDVDGIHLDYVRYPESTIEDGGSFRQYGDGMKREDWRRSNLDRFVTDVYRSIKKQKPRLKIGSAPVGLFQAMNGVQSDFTGYDGVYQDARGWLRKGVQDYLVPQLYWDLGDENGKKDPDFEQLCVEWTSQSYGRHIYAGIGVYKKKIRKEVEDQIIVSQMAGTRGEALFRYSHLESLEDELSVYRYPALIPPMPWIDSIPPLPPAGVVCTASGVLRWKRPEPARDGDLPAKYVIYRSSTKPVNIGDPRNIIAILAGSASNYVDIRMNGKTYYYSVTSVDADNNESSQPWTAAVVAAKSQIEPIPRQQEAAFPTISPGQYTGSAFVHTSAGDTLSLLAQNYPDPFTEKTLILYEVAGAGHVRLIVTHMKSGRETPVVDGQQERGTYIALFTSTDGDEAEYECRLEAGGVVKKITMKKR